MVRAVFHQVVDYPMAWIEVQIPENWVWWGIQKPDGGDGSTIIIGVRHRG